MGTMVSLVNYGAAPHSVELRESPIPTIGDDQVLLRVAAVGVCGSDLHQTFGTPSWPVNYPVILGHEFCGTIAQVGTRVRNFKEGDRVVSETAAQIDVDSPFCRSGKYNLDPNRRGYGAGVDGAMAEYVAVPERCLHRLPARLAFEKAAVVEPCCVAYNACCMNVGIRPGEMVAIIGPGPIGLLCAVMARLSGANPLIVIGTPADKARLQAAKRLGVNLAVGADGEDPVEIVRGLGDGFGCDTVIDAAGVSASLKTAIEIVRPGGQIAKVGWGPQPYNASLDPLVQKAITLQGSFSHNWPIWERVIWMLDSGQIDLTEIITLESPLSDWKNAFDSMHSGNGIKSVLKP